MNLSGRLTLAMVTLVLVTAAVVGVVTYRNLAEAVLPSELARLQAHAERQAAYLDEVIAAVRSDVQVFSTGAAAFEGIVRARSNGGIDPQDGSSEEVWRLRLARRLTAELQAKPDYVQIRLIGIADGGREIVRVDRSGPAGAVRTVPADELQRKGDRDYFVETIKLPPGGIYLSRMDLNQEHGKIVVPHQPVIRAATPVYTAAGAAFGILIINIDLCPTFNRMGTPEHPGGQVLVVNRDGYYLLHPRSEKTFGFDLGRADRLQQDYPELIDRLGATEGFVRLVQTRMSGKLGVALAPVNVREGPWAGVVEVVSEAQLLSAVALVRRSSLVAGCAVTLLAVGLAVWLSRSLTNPLLTLTRTVESFSIGKTQPAQVAATGEIGVLARAFEHMQQEVNATTEALSRSEHRFRALIEHSADGIALIDANNKILYLSPSVALIEGYTPEELIGRNGAENTHPDDLPLVAAVVEKLVASPGKPIPVLWRRRHKDGRWLWLEGVATNLLADPAVGAIVTNYRDITERKRIEARFRRLVDSNAQGVIFWNTKGEITKANDAFLHIVRHTREDLAAGRVSWAAMTPPEYAHLDQRALVELDAKGVCTPFEKEYIRKDGSRVPILLGAAMFEDEPGEGVYFVLDITSQKEGEAALKHSEERFRTMVDSMAQLAWIARADGYIFWYNQRWYEYTGTTPEQMEGWGWQSVHDPEVLPKVMVNWKAAIDSGQPFEMEFPLRGADGQFRTFLTRGHPLKDSQGRVVQWFGTNTDIDVLKQMEDSLRATQARLNSTLAAGSVGTWTWDIPKDRLVADEFTAGAFSIEMEAAAKGLPAAAYLQAVMKEDQLAVSASLARAVETCGHYDIEYRVRQKNGGLLWLQARGRVEGDQTGKALNFHGAVMDITARKLAEAAVRASEEHFRFLNDLAVATRLLADPTQIMAVAARMLGEHLHASRCAYAEVETDSEKFTILHDYTDGCASTVGQYQLSLFGPRAVATLRRGETLIICSVDEELPPGEGADMFNAIGIQAIICCPLVKEGGLQAMMAVHQAVAREWQPAEITLVQDVVERCWATIERRTAEERIRQLNAELEQRVIERTAQLEAANKELEAFSYSVSHDLRAPLRAVDGYSQAVLEDFSPLLPEEGRRQLQTIRNSAQRMGQLIDDLLTFSRLSRQSMLKQPVETGALVRAALADLALVRNSPQADIQIGELAPCVGDPALLKQVWLNLLANALKYTGKRAAARVEVGSTEQQGEMVYFVRDNGAGFDMRYAHKLFGVFQRLHRQEDYEGTGVGLAIVQRIIHRHGGRIWAEAAVDRGATFYFTLNREA